MSPPRNKDSMKATDEDNKCIVVCSGSSTTVLDLSIQKGDNNDRAVEDTNGQNVSDVNQDEVSWETHKYYY